MLNLPEPPQTRIVRQLKCVSCQEQFTISEDEPTHEKGQHSEKNWQMATNNKPDIKLYYRPDRSRRSASPESHTFPDPDSLTYRTWENEHWELVHCPRCGADNRNWLNIIHPSQTAVTGIISLLPSGLRTWQQRFPLAMVGILFSFLFCFTAFLFLLEVDYSITLDVSLILFIFLAALFPAAELTQTKNWKAFRQEKHLRKLKNVKQDNVEVGFWLRGFIFVFLVAFVLPVVFFQMGPRVFDAVVMVIKGSPAGTVTNVAAPYVQALDDSLEGLPDDISDMTTAVLVDLKAAPDGNNDVVMRILGRFRSDLDSVLRDTASSTYAEIVPQIEALKTIVDDAKADIERAQEDEIQKEIKANAGGVGYMALWGLMVGLSGLLSVFTSMRALKDYVQQIDGQLPPPIFYSVANMTRVVVWEAKRALEIGDEVEGVQWTAVNRTIEGGINLTGIYRDHDPYRNGDPLTTRVLAQRYKITADRWGHIIHADIQPTRVLQQPRLPRQSSDSLEVELFGPVANRRLAER